MMGLKTMGSKTKISWTNSRNADGIEIPGATWNIVSGCTKVARECKFCYVERDWHRFAHLPAYAGRRFTDVATHEDRLDQPLRWQRPRRIFVCSTADLFHDDVPDDFLDRAFAIMLQCPRHTFLLLTKRPERMQAYLSSSCRQERVSEAAKAMRATHESGPLSMGPVQWPLPNVDVGVTAGTMEMAHRSLPLLMNTPAAVRWLSAEPLLEPLFLEQWMSERLPVSETDRKIPEGTLVDGMERRGDEWIRRVSLDGVVVGGESGNRSTARPMLPEWARAIEEQCSRHGRAFFFKQQGVWAEPDQEEEHAASPSAVWVNRTDGAIAANDEYSPATHVKMHHVGRKKAGEKLYGREYRELPSNTHAIMTLTTKK